MFDPEKVERHTCHDSYVDVMEVGRHVEEFVLASDFEALLALYREAIKKPPTDLERIEASYVSGSQAYGLAVAEARAEMREIEAAEAMMHKRAERLKAFIWSAENAGLSGEIKLAEVDPAALTITEAP